MTKKEERKGSALDIGQNQNNEWITLEKYNQDD